MRMRSLMFTLIISELFSITFCPAAQHNQDPTDFPEYERIIADFGVIRLSEKNLSEFIFPTDMIPNYIDFDKGAPDFCLISFENARKLFKRQKYAEAISYLNETISICPDYSEAWYNRGYNKFKLKLYNEALEDFNEAIELNPKDAEYWAFKGITLVKLENIDEALFALNTSMSIDPGISSAKTWKAYIQDSIPVECEEEILYYNAESYVCK